MYTGYFAKLKTYLREGLVPVSIALVNYPPPKGVGLLVFASTGLLVLRHRLTQGQLPLRGLVPSTRHVGPCQSSIHCWQRGHPYLCKEVADYRPNGMWLNENGMLVTCEDACKMTQHYYESYDRSACNNMVTYRFTYRTATGGLLSVVTLTFNDFYKV